MASITKRGDSFLIRVSNGFDASMKRIMVSTTYTPKATTPKAIEKEVKQFAHDFEERVKKGEYCRAEEMPFRDFTEEWYKNWAVDHLTEIVQENYKNAIVRNAFPMIGHLKVGAIQPLDIQKLVAHLR